MKTDAQRMFFLASRADKMFNMITELDSLIEQMDDTAHLESARLLITESWEGERDIIRGFEGTINDGIESMKSGGAS